MLRNVTLALATVLIGFHLYELIWPFVDPAGVITKGTYRGLKIGDSKANTISTFYSPFKRVSLVGYEILGGTDRQRYVVPTLETPAQPLALADRWYLRFPGIHKETITLEFETDRIISITYRRNAFAP
jgi:hypothetical protein